MQTSKRRLSQSELHAFTAWAFDWLGWLLAVILKLDAPRRSRRLKRLVAAMERFVEHTIFLMAARRLAAPPPRTRRPRSVPPGFRRRAASRRLLFRRARICDRRLDPHARVLRLLAALARPEPYIARFVARLRKRLRAGALSPVAPPAHACASAAFTRAAYADSS